MILIWRMLFMNYENHKDKVTYKEIRKAVSDMFWIVKWNLKKKK